MNELLIKERAYQIWEDEGRPEGRDKEHWDQATRELLLAGDGKDHVDSPVVGEGPTPATNPLR
jgi:hypothetical protein